MQKYLLSYMTMMVLLFGANLEHMTIGHQDFSLTTEAYHVYDSKGEILRFYKEERNNDLTFIFSLILRDRTGPCTAKSMEDGTYEINGTDILLYTLWDRRGKAYEAPYGARIQHYKVMPDHSVKRLSSKIYVETNRRNYDPSNGMKFLFQVPKTSEEQASLKAYIEHAQREFKGEFIQGKAGLALIKQVEAAFHRKVKAAWRAPTVVD